MAQIAQTATGSLICVVPANEASCEDPGGSDPAPPGLPLLTRHARLLARRPLPDGIVCYSDVVAFGVVSGLWMADVEPGRDVALASFDDIAEAQLQGPPLTSVATYPELAGAEAARLFMERLDAPDAKPRRVVLEPRLHVRASSSIRDRHPPNRREGRS
jgi:Periplasmic binding protein-like domain